ncbi:MAG: 5'-methylthioadenosine/adenosylhomocysteine nucleosidase [Streptococcaceae bacterium]|jgi:adenosylhomocysteine nucleosidase|nr:5'-methylthioadenosine/adenosylhomocysteine nucleosidase [Streptococcaceae bacterium]
MKIGIISAMDEELARLVDALGTRDEKHTRYGFVFHAGRLGRHEVVLVKSGIGKVAASVATTLLVQLFEVDALINTGSAGAVSRALSVGDVVLADTLAYHDVDVTAFGYTYGQMAQQPLYFESSRYFIDELKKTLVAPAVGLIVSADSFVTDTARIRAHFPEALATDMESTAIAQTAVMLGKPFAIIRAISDNADHAASVSFDEFILEAGKKSAETLLAFLERLV